jgi:hypothetical protein
MGVMHDLSLTSSSDIDAELTSAPGGSGALSMSWSTSAECKAIPNSADGVECSNGTAQFDWQAVVWIEVSEAGTYDAQFTMNCSGGGTEGAYVAGASTRLSRHVGGALRGSFPNSGLGGPNINGLNPFNAPTPPPINYVTVSATNFVCEPGVPIVANATWELSAPADPSTPDIVAVVITVSSIMISPVDPFVVLEPAVGSYTQSGAISGTINVVRVQ